MQPPQPPLAEEFSKDTRRGGAWEVRQTMGCCAGASFWSPAGTMEYSGSELEVLGHGVVHGTPEIECFSGEAGLAPLLKCGAREWRRPSPNSPANGFARVVRVGE